jgi:MFS family permease
MTADATHAAATGNVGARALLRIPDFRRVWAAQTISDVGDGLTTLTLMIVVTQLTHSTAALALIAIAVAVPTILVGPLAGVYVDRWDRRRVMLASDLLRAVVVLGLAGAASTGQVGALYVLAFIEASIGAFFTPARSAIMPRIVPAEGLMTANSLNQMTRVVATVIGGAAAGVLVGVAGLSWPAFVVDSLTFLASFALVIRVTVDGRPVATTVATTRRGVGGELGAGLRIVVRSRVLLGTMIGAGVTMLGVGAINVLFVPFLLRDVHLPVTWLGFIDGAQTASMVLAAGLVAAIAARFRPTTIVVWSLVGAAFSIGLVAGTDSVWQVAALLFAAGWFITPLQAGLVTIVQTSTDDAFRGRVASTLHAVMGAASVTSMALAGVFGDVVGVRPVFVLGGLVTGAAAVAAALLYRGAMPATKEQEEFEPAAAA